MASEDSESEVPELVGGVLAGKSETLALSQRLAQILYLTQPTIASSGLLVVATGEVEGAPACAVMKLELETGARTSGLEVLIEDELFWTQNTTVFKTGLFVGEDLLDIVICDSQTGDGKRIANYWREFLGCEFRTTPAETTLNAHKAITTWANSLSDPLATLKVMRALQTEIASNTADFDPNGFIQRHVDKASDKTSLRKALTDAEVPQQRFAKDSSYLRSALRRFVVEMDDGIKVSAPFGHSDTIEIEQLDDGRSRVTVVGVVKKINKPS